MTDHYIDRITAPPPLSLKQMQAEVTSVNKAHGWFDEDRSFGDDIALLHTEVSEMFEAYRLWGLDDATGTATPGAAGSLPKPEGVGSEAADVLVRLLDTCERAGIDLEQEFRRKISFNHSRPFKHGGKRI